MKARAGLQFCCVYQAQGTAGCLGRSVNRGVWVGFGLRTLGGCWSGCWVRRRGKACTGNLGLGRPPSPAFPPLLCISDSPSSHPKRTPSENLSPGPTCVEPCHTAERRHIQGTEPVGVGPGLSEPGAGGSTCPGSPQWEAWAEPSLLVLPSTNVGGSELREDHVAPVWPSPLPVPPHLQSGAPWGYRAQPFRGSRWAQTRRGLPGQRAGCAFWIWPARPWKRSIWSQRKPHIQAV